MFKFGFSSDDTENTADEDQEKLTWVESKEVLPLVLASGSNPKVSSIKCGDYNINYISDKDIIDALQTKTPGVDNSLLNAEQNHSDLITAVYEGGLKIWECTFDLLTFINSEDVILKDRNVLDLGCGTGIVGIFACLKGAKTVFQDYNEEVIKSATIPNVASNGIACDNCKFYSGDWDSFRNLWKKATPEKFDFIFTSETIYNIGNYTKILNIFRELLKKTGMIYLAAKSHYFGVGGGISHFEDFLKKEDVFNYSTCWVCSDGVKRAIIKITLK